MLQRAVCVVLTVLVLAGCAVPKKAVRHEPLNEQDHLSLGVAYELRGEWGLALEEYAQAARTDPRGSFYMGNLLFQQNELEAAEEEYRKAMITMQNNPDLFNNLAWLLYTRQENLDEAEELAARAVQYGASERAEEYRDTLDQIRQLRREIREEAALGHSLGDIEKGPRILAEFAELA